VLLEPAAAGGAWGALLAILDDPSLTDTLIFVAADGMGAPDGVTMLPAEAALLAAALRLPPRRARRSLPTSTRALTAGLDRDALLLRYQPVIRIADRRMVLVEALARWRGRPMMHGPESFVPAVERAGKARPLALAVIARAAQDIGSLACHWGIGVSVNLSLDQLQRQDMGFWISQALKAGGLPAKNLSIELTETTPVHDRSLLRRALRRMAAVGHAVFLDDLAIDDGRLGLQSLGFAGVKLDKSLVERLPEDARACALCSMWCARPIAAARSSPPRAWRMRCSGLRWRRWGCIAPRATGSAGHCLPPCWAYGSGAGRRWLKPPAPPARQSRR
jgi:EAL domain-containing protein (putative c-di-GMP-specific phosphodiesterase class I)